MSVYFRKPSADVHGDRAFISTIGNQSVDVTLDDIMGFDHIISVDTDGNVSDGFDTTKREFWAPELMDGELADSEWELVSAGYTGQHANAASPIMHDSEYLGGRLADDILATPGYYVAVVCYWGCTHGPDNSSIDDCDEDHAEGWAVAYRPFTD